MPRVEPVDWIDLVGRELVLMGTQQSIVPDLTTNRDILSVRVGSEATPRYTVSLDTSGNVVHQISPNTANFIIQDGTGPRITITRNQVGIGTTTYSTVGTAPRLHIGDLPADWVTWGQWGIALINPYLHSIIVRFTSTTNFRLLTGVHNNTEGYQEAWFFEMYGGDQAPLDIWATKRPGGVRTDILPLRLSMDGWVRLGNYHYGGAATPIGAYLSGHLYAWADAVHDIGSADTNRFRDLYQTGTHFFRPANITSNRDILSVRVGSETNPRHKVLINTTGQLVFQSGPGGATAPADALTLPADTTSRPTLNRGVILSGHISFTADNLYDIGADGNRVRTLGAITVFANEYRYGGTGIVEINTSTAGVIRFLRGGGVIWQIDANNHLYPATDNAYDLGSSTNRIRDGYFSNMVSVRKDQGDYGGNFATYTPPAGREGAFLFAVDTNTTNPGRRMYVYLNGAWWYVNLS